MALIRINEKGSKRRPIGLHYNAAHAIEEYLDQGELTRGPLFRPRSGPKSQHRLANRHFTETGLYHVVMGYLQRLPGALQSVQDEQGHEVRRCIYTPHSLRATCATRLLDLGVDIAKVQELLGHRHITTTQIYDKRRRGVKESASHDVAY